MEEKVMKKRVKRAPAKSSRRARSTKSKAKRTTSANSAKATSKALLPKVKRVAKKAAVAASLAAIGTALSELKPEQRSAEHDVSDQGESNRRNASARE
jgi:hypothetical protein